VAIAKRQTENTRRFGIIPDWHGNGGKSVKSETIEIVIDTLNDSSSALTSGRYPEIKEDIVNKNG
jgi:hypothetical protein